MTQETSRRHRLFALSLDRPVATTMLVVAVVVFGLVALTKLRLALMPAISYPSITVRTQLPGSPPTEVEAKISIPLEDALGNLRQLERISSRSRSGTSDVILEFAWNADLDLALVEIAERIDKVYLPREASRPLILRYDPSQDPLMRLGLSGEEDPVRLRRLADEEVARSLAGLEGVASVRVVGGREEEIRVSLEEERLRQLNLDLQTIAERLGRENINLASGIITEGGVDYVVRTLNEFLSPAEMADLIVAERGEAMVRLRDLGEVWRRERDPEVITRDRGRPSVEIEIHKEADANAMAVARAIRRRLFGSAPDQAAARAAHARQVEERQRRLEERRRAEAQRESEQESGKQEEGGAKQEGRQRGGPGGGAGWMPPLPPPTLAAALPGAVTLRVVADQSVFIAEAIQEVQHTALVGAALAVAVLLVFLRRPGPTAIVATAIPISVVATFVPMQLSDTSLNVMSLGGLALGLGMLVDNAIVVIESIYRCREEGDRLLEAAARGTREVGSAVVASTLTTIAVFFPIVFVEGIAGQIFRDMSLTVVFSLLASLAVALFFIPMLASRQPPVPPAPAALALLREGLEGPSRQPWILRLVVVPLRAAAMALVEAVTRRGPVLARALRRLLDLVLLLGALLPPIPPLWAAARAHAGERFRGPTVVFCGGPAWWRFGPGFVYGWFRGVLTLLTEGCLGLTGDLLQLAVGLLVGLSLAVGLLLGACLAPLLAILAGLIALLQRIYPALLRGALAHRFLVLLVAAALLAGSILGARGLGSELVPQVYQGEFILRLAATQGTPIERTDMLVRRVEEVLARTRGIASWYTRVGVEPESNPEPEEGSHTATILVSLDAAYRSPEQEMRVRQELRDTIQVPGLQGVEIRSPSLFSLRHPIEVEITGHELPILSRLARQAEERLQEARRPDGSPLLGDLTSSQVRGTREVRLTYDRELLARFDLTVTDVAGALRQKVAGELATAFREEDRRIDVVTRIREADASSVEQVLDLVVATREGREITVREILEHRELGEGPAEIRRVGHRRAAVISGSPTGLDLAHTVGVLQGQLADLELPEGFRTSIAGQYREMERSSGSLLFALGLAAFLVYVVMASQFEHLVQPLVIMVSLPLALVGVVAGLLLTGTPLSILVFIGLIVLAGIVVNNAIVLVDYVNRLRRDRGLSREEAVRVGARVRLRPILMTTLTTVLALVPMALGLGEGAELRQPLAITVVAGLISATLLTLVVIPVVYTLVDDLTARRTA